MALKYVEPKKETWRVRRRMSQTTHEPSSEAVTAEASSLNRAMSFTDDRCSFMDASSVMMLPFITFHSRTLPSEPPLMIPEESFIPRSAVTLSCALAATKSNSPVSRSCARIFPSSQPLSKVSPSGMKLTHKHFDVQGLTSIFSNSFAVSVAHTRTSEPPPVAKYWLCFRGKATLVIPNACEDCSQIISGRIKHLDVKGCWAQYSKRSTSPLEVPQ